MPSSVPRSLAWPGVRTESSWPLYARMGVCGSTSPGAALCPYRYACSIWGKDRLGVCHPSSIPAAARVWAGGWGNFKALLP